MSRYITTDRTVATRIEDRTGTLSLALLDLLLVYPDRTRHTIYPVLYGGAAQDRAARLLVAEGLLAEVGRGDGWYIVERVASS